MKNQSNWISINKTQAANKTILKVSWKKHYFKAAPGGEIMTICNQNKSVTSPIRPLIPQKNIQRYKK
jgi:hypothetical protein